MDITYDPPRTTRTLPIAACRSSWCVASRWASALVVEDTRQVYAETRYQALGKIDGRLHMGGIHGARRVAAHHQPA